MIVVNIKTDHNAMNGLPDQYVLRHVETDNRLNHLAYQFVKFKRNPLRFQPSTLVNIVFKIKVIHGRLMHRLSVSKNPLLAHDMAKTVQRFWKACFA